MIAASQKRILHRGNKFFLVETNFPPKCDIFVMELNSSLGKRNFHRKNESVPVETISFSGKRILPHGNEYFLMETNSSSQKRNHPRRNEVPSEMFGTEVILIYVVVPVKDGL